MEVDLMISLTTKSIIRLTLALSLPLQVLTAQRLTFETNETASAGIRVVSADTPEFAAIRESAIHPQASPAIEDILPYAFVLRNLSDREIIAISVRWTLYDKSGKGRPMDVLIGDATPFTGGIVLGPQKARIVTPFGNLGVVPGPSNETIFRIKNERLRAFKNSPSVTLSIEAIAFRDGTIVGPDRGRSFQKIQAHFDAERDIQVGAIEAGEGGVVNYLRSFSTLPLGQLRTDSYGDLYRLNRRQIAAAYLQKATKDVRSLLSDLQKKINAAPRLSLHR